MKHLAMLFCVSLLAVTAPAPSARADVAVSIGFFYDALDPYGDWIYTPNYGYIWQPSVSQQPGWSPYSDGYWAYTDAGWTWISNEDFGWATYHYGRWARVNHRWCWVPGYEWAPAWVSWRQADDYVGWAPLPPEARWSVSIGFSSWADSYYDIGPSYYNFVPVNRFSSRGSLRPFILDRSRNVTYVDRSVNITNITYNNTVVNNVFVGGPDPRRMDRFGAEPVRRLSLRRDDDGFRRDWMDRGRGRPDNFRGLSRIENDQLLVAAPVISRDQAPAAPQRVRERFDRPEVDRGWRDLDDSKAAERLRERQREEAGRISQDKMPEKTPLIVTGQAPPKVVGATKSDERPDPRRHILDEEVRRALPQRPGAPAVDDQPPAAKGGTQPGVAKGDRPGMPDRDGVPGRDGRADSLPGVGKGNPPGVGKGNPLDRDGVTGQPRRPGGLPGVDGRKGGGPPDRDGLPGRDGRPDRDGRPGATDDNDTRRPGGLPLPDMDKGKGKGPDRDGIPGRPDAPTLPGADKGKGKGPDRDDDARRPGADLRRIPTPGGATPPTIPNIPRATNPDEPPRVNPRRIPSPDESAGGGRGPMPKKGPPTEPKARPDPIPQPKMPEIRPPEPRRSGPPEARPEPRRIPRPDVPSARPTPSLPKAMPQPQRPPQAAPRMPSAPPQARPAPMPQPQARPAPTPKPAPAAGPGPGAVKPEKRKDPRR